MSEKEETKEQKTAESLEKEWRKTEKKLDQITRELEDARKAAASWESQTKDARKVIGQVKQDAQEKLRESQRLTGMLKKTIAMLRKSNVMIPMEVAMELTELQARLENATVLEK